MSDILRPCDCESGFCNRLPNPFEGHVCRHDSIEIGEELTKAHAQIESLQRTNEELRRAEDEFQDLETRLREQIADNERLRATAITPEMREMIEATLKLNEMVGPGALNHYERGRDVAPAAIDLLRDLLKATSQ